MPAPSHPAHRPMAVVFLLALLTGCAQVPELDATVPDHLRDAAYPALIPLDGSLAPNVLPADAASEIEDSLAARRDRLQARAKRLNTPIVDPGI
ncbi:MAG: hypothetical protein ACI8R4_002944 [Paracoccaceae bacterium]|jgi:hypothetical protein